MSKDEKVNTTGIFWLIEKIKFQQKVNDWTSCRLRDPNLSFEKI